MTAYDLAEIVEQKREAVGSEMVEFTWKGETFEMPHPLFVDDEFKEDLTLAETDVDLSIQYLGDEQYDRFRELGGKSAFVVMFLERVAKDSREADNDGKPYTVVSLLGPCAEATEAALDATYPGLCDPQSGAGVVARFWQGDISLRKLRVLVENLPPVNARAAALNDGVWWSDLHALLNLIEFRMRENTGATYEAASGKPGKRPKYNPKPWKKPEGTYGDTNGRTPQQVMAFLDSLAPPKG
ncbi:tail assembly chaperone [Gordonia phage Huffy]|uniref:Tail assembly chaperone n=1 Tax=Gordonia phage TZGordon TaxID=2744004 RepID=A0A6N0A611_9CAUD|nr:tail assembly chaperone [Gordonia phage TZGordon]AQY55623.1 tail assembly chaperone [Gordonia phage Huffy]AQY55705.1 tail assembly chaperone [Gordonia phage DinoDaryn]QKO02942.1 tail assembly chaperone [Gordonia phage TZGordon]